MCARVHTQRTSEQRPFEAKEGEGKRGERDLYDLKRTHMHVRKRAHDSHVDILNEGGGGWGVGGG